LTTEVSNGDGLALDTRTVAVSAPSSLQGRLLIWQGGHALIWHRPWFPFDNPPLPLSLHLFGYGPEFFRYFFPLERPNELTGPQRDVIYRFAEDAHNSLVGITVEQGAFGLASYLSLLVVLTAIGVRLLLRKFSTLDETQKLIMAALMTAIGRRVLEQMVGVPHLSDTLLFWTLLAVVVAVPNLNGSLKPRIAETGAAIYHSSLPNWQNADATSAILKLSLAFIVASIIVVFNMVKNPNYAVAEIRATASGASLLEGRLDFAMN
jgi:hypothetical protein